MKAQTLYVTIILALFESVLLEVIIIRQTFATLFPCVLGIRLFCLVSQNIVDILFTSTPLFRDKSDL